MKNNDLEQEIITNESARKRKNIFIFVFGNIGIMLLKMLLIIATLLLTVFTVITSVLGGLLSTISSIITTILIIVTTLMCITEPEQFFNFSHLSIMFLALIPFVLVMIAGEGLPELLSTATSWCTYTAMDLKFIKLK